LIKKIKKFNKK